MLETDGTTTDRRITAIPRQLCALSCISWLASAFFLHPVNSMMQKVRLAWHRRDLRLHDNSLYERAEDLAGIISVYIFDEDDFRPRTATCNKHWTAVSVGPHAARLQIEAVRSLRESLRKIGGDLLVRKGDPTKILPELVEQLKPDEVFWNEEPGVYEASLSKSMWKAIRSVNPTVAIRTNMQYTLYHPEDLPRGEDDWKSFLIQRKSTKRRKKTKKIIPSSSPGDSSGRPRTAQDQLIDISEQRWVGMPRIMGDFRKAAKKATRPRSCLESPQHLQAIDGIASPGDIPTIHELFDPLLESCKDRKCLGMPQETIAYFLETAYSREVSRSFGEAAALAHLTNFCQNHAAVAVRNLACVDNNQSSRISHFLAFGCLSPRKVIEEAEKVGEDCNWVISHMTMRDFFLYTCLANGSKMFQLSGIPVSQKNSSKIEWKDWDDPIIQQRWEKWVIGETGFPLVDAAMKELQATGYCSNRVRQNVASFLTKDLGIDWRGGAEWFQFLLEDHCVGANWGNWLYFSGVGPDPKHRHFKTVSQALKYDPDGRFVKKWLPALNEITCEETPEAHLRPWDYDQVAWKDTIVAAKSQFIWQDLQRLEEKGSLINSRLLD